MRDGMVEVRDEFYRIGKEVRQRRFIEGVLMFDVGSPVVIAAWATFDSAWTTIAKRPTSLVKEGPKAMVVYGGAK